MVVSPSAGSEGAGLHPEEETPNPGTGNQVENEVINVEDEEDARADEPSRKRGKKTTSECWDHFYKTTKTVEVDGKKVEEQWAKCKYCTYEGKRNTRNGTSVFLNHIKMHSVKSGQQLLKLEKKELDSVSVETYRDGLAQISDAVWGIKAFVLAVKLSPQLEEDFYKCAVECGLPKNKGLQLDVQTRWNSTYYMLRDALFYRKAFDRLHEIDKKKFDKFAPTAAEWEMALTLCRCLKKFDDLTKLLSVAFFLDPRYKRTGIEHYMRKVHGDLLYRGKVEELLVVVKRMYLAYASKYSQSTTASNSTATAQEHATDFMEEDEDDYFQSQQGTHVSYEGDTDTDLEKYMAETLKLLKDAFDKFDILSWWKTHQDVYPVLSMLARDVLTIQVSTVASESAFSAGGRVIDPFRSRLDPQVVEALICTKDWVAATRKGDTKRGAGLGSIVNDLEFVETLVANMSLEEQLDEKDKEGTDIEE
ncbi:hypothetical protein ACQ4PT_007997 [Festuca glaucescens]